MANQDSPTHRLADEAKARLANLNLSAWANFGNLTPPQVLQMLNEEKADMKQLGELIIALVKNSYRLREQRQVRPRIV
jgi:hypothetical protein